MPFTRRSLIFQASSLALLSVDSAVAERAGPATDLDYLKAMRTRLQERRDQLDRHWGAVYRQLPAWCRAGPKYSDGDGNAVGPTVGWPAAVGEAIPLSDGCVLVRPAPTDLRALFNKDVPEHLRQARIERYRARSRQLISRLRASRALQRAVGLPASAAAWQSLDLEIDKIEAAINELTSGR